MEKIQSALNPVPNSGSFLFDSIVFGPVYSRRLGSSLGINLLPTKQKVCTFNCIYCECGFTYPKPDKSQLPKFETVVKTIESALQENKDKEKPIDSITFAGNGEPTMHPEFLAIIEKTVEMRNIYYPKSRVAVLTNGTLLHNSKIRKALSLIDDPIIKLDSAIDETALAIDLPLVKYNIKNIVEQIKKLSFSFVLQTMFIKARHNETEIDNTTDKEIDAWLETIKQIKPRLVQIYTVSRIPAEASVTKISPEILENIAQRVNELGYKTLVTP